MHAESHTRSWFEAASRARRINLDDVSEDIRKLEQYFLSSALRIPLQIEFHDSGIVSEQFEEFTAGEGLVFQEVESVAWEPLGAEGAWRLTYRRLRRHGVMGADGPFFRNSEADEHCPLVEASARDRIRGHRALPDLVREAGAVARASLRSA
jgi:hypothetical protein